MRVVRGACAAGALLGLGVAAWVAWPLPRALLEPGAAPDQWLASYSVGAGIVADSDPVREWHETMHKARTFLGLSARDDATPSGYLIQSG